MDTVASSKLHDDAAETIVAPESNNEDTKLLKTLILAVREEVTTELWRVHSGRTAYVSSVRDFVGTRPWRARVSSPPPPFASHPSSAPDAIANT
jgi:hypothetical protein